jgi:two-component system cell cycle sensor histidine kinase PleC
VLRQDRVDVDALMKAAADRFRPQAKRAGLTFVTGMPTGAVLSADPFALQRMVGNIIDNAIRFTPAGGKVTVAAFAAPDGVVLEITDTGLGMSEERLASLSQPFVLGDSTFTRETGAGLGIAIARAIAEQSGGRLAIDSSPQLGTTVAISLPVAQVMPHVAAEAA